MILIDLQADEVEQEIILTSDDQADDGAVLLLKHDATRKEFTIELGDNTSTAINRYDRFIVPNESFVDLPEGLFTYQLKNPEAVAIFEVGKLYVKPAKLQETIPSSPQLSNDIPVFKN